MRPILSSGNLDQQGGGREIRRSHDGLFSGEFVQITVSLADDLPNGFVLEEIGFEALGLAKRDSGAFFVDFPNQLRAIQGIVAPLKMEVVGLPELLFAPGEGFREGSFVDFCRILGPSGVENRGSLLPFPEGNDRNWLDGLQDREGFARLKNDAAMREV